MPVSLPLRFNAGQVSFNEALQKYIPLPTPGEIIVDNSPEGDGCYSFVWRPRDSTSAETEELLVFQGDVVWQKINSCTSGRVYMLAFLSSGAKHLYWMQDVNDEGAMHGRWRSSFCGFKERPRDCLSDEGGPLRIGRECYSE